MGYTPITSEEIQPKKPVRQELMQKIKDNFDDHELRLTLLGYEGLVNTSLDYDIDNDGVPDGWTRNLYTNGSGGFSSSSPAHGSRAYYFTHPGGSGNGGGYLESNYHPVTELKTYKIAWLMRSTVAGVKNVVSVRFYTKDKTYLSETTLYSSTSNPTSWTLIISSFTPPSSARYIKLRLVGGDPSVTTGGTTYYDGVMIDPFISVNADFTLPEASTTSTSYVDVNSTTITLPYYISTPVRLIFFAEVKKDPGASYAYQRFRVGAIYSNETTTRLNEYISFPYTLQLTPAKSFTIYQQLAANYIDLGEAYGRKPFAPTEVEL